MGSIIFSLNTTGNGFLQTCSKLYANRFARTSLYSNCDPGSRSFLFFQSSIPPSLGGLSAQSQRSKRQPDQSDDWVRRCLQVILALCDPSNSSSHTYSLTWSSTFLMR